MRKFKRMYLSMGALCLASTMCMSSAFAMKSGQNVAQPESSEQTDSLDQTTELEIAKAELAELKEKYAQQTAELDETKLALEMAKKRIAELERLPDGIKVLEQRIAELEARVVEQERQLEAAREILAQRDAQINQLKAANEHIQHENLNHTANLDEIRQEKEIIVKGIEALTAECGADREELSLLCQMDEQLKEFDSERVSLQIRAMMAESQARTEEARADAAEARVAELERQLKEAQSQIIAQAHQIESLSGTQKETIAEYEQKIFDLQVELQGSEKCLDGMLEMQEELNESKETIAELERKLEKITRLYKGLRQKNCDLEAELKQCRESFIKHYC